MKIKALLFDMDGVLVEAREWHFDALNKALGLFGLEISRYDHLVTYDGLPTRRKLEILSVEKGLPRGLHDFVSERKQAYTTQLIQEKCRPVFHHQYALSRLRKEGYRIAVCSNSIRESIQLMMDNAGLTGYLDFFLSNQDVSQSKPDPEIYSKAIAKLGLSASECLAIEDNENGVRAVKASGAHLLQVPSPEDVNYENIRRRILEIEKGIA